MPRVFLGTAGHEGLSGKDGRAAIVAALKLGYRGIDTAEMNRNLLDVAWAHLKAGIPRSELFIIAKIAPWNYGYARTRTAFLRQLDELRTDYVDLLLLNWTRSTRWTNEQKRGSWRALEEF